MYNIMPGSSHWFQVHDQVPFAELKNYMESKKYENLQDVSLTSEQRRMILMGLFYEAEAHAFTKEIVRGSFEKVGLWPWKPKKILKMCRENSPPVSQPPQDEIRDRLIDAIKVRRESNQAYREVLLRRLKPVEVIAIQKSGKQKEHKKGTGQKSVDDKQQNPGAAKRMNKCIYAQPPAKRSRISESTEKRCCARGCGKTHFWSKKWGFCSNCKKNFCPTHIHLLHKHKCK